MDSFTVGWTVVQLLNDQLAFPIFTNWLSKSYNADFTGATLLRADAYERMFCNYIAYAQSANGGTESQNLFSQLGGYAAWIALAANGGSVRRRPRLVFTSLGWSVARKSS